MADYNEIERALSYVSNSDDRELWVRMGAGIKTELGEDGFDVWDRWSQAADNYNSRSAKAVWKSLQPGRVNIGSIFHEAKIGGYKPNKKQFKPVNPEELKRKALERQQREAQAIAERLEAADQAKDKAQALFNKGDPVNPNHPYLLKKGIADPAILSNLRQLGNNLLIPVKQNKEIVAVQKINPEGGKYFGKDEKLTGSAFLIGDASKAKNGLILTEGLATGASLHAASGKPVLVVFAAHNLVAVAENMKTANCPITIAADNDFHTKNAGIKFAEKAAKILSDQADIKMPVFSDKDTAAYQEKHGAGKYPSDFNDLHELRGLDAVQQLIGDKPVLKKSESEPKKESKMKLQEPEYFKDLPDWEPDYEPFDPDSDPIFDPVHKAENYIEVDLEQIKVKSVPVNKKVEQDTLGTTSTGNTKSTVQEQENPSVQQKNQPGTEHPQPVTDLKYKAPPESIKHKYLYADGMYLDSNGRTTVFTDTGKQLKTSKSDLQTVHDMVEVAKEKGWSHIKLFGKNEFKRQAFLEAESQGIKTSGYNPTPEDLAALKHLQDERALNKLENVPVPEKSTENKDQKAQVTPKDLEPEANTRVSAEGKPDKQITAQAASEASALKAQNQMPTEAQIESPPKADVDSDVKMVDIGTQSVNSEVKIMADKIAQSGNVKGLDKANSAKYQVYTGMAKAVVANMSADYRQDAMRNFDTNMDKAINGTTLNMPAPLQTKVEKQQQREQVKQNEMELER